MYAGRCNFLPGEERKEKSPHRGTIGGLLLNFETRSLYCAQFEHGHTCPEMRSAPSQSRLSAARFWRVPRAADRETGRMKTHRQSGRPSRTAFITASVVDGPMLGFRKTNC